MIAQTTLSRVTSFMFIEIQTFPLEKEWFEWSLSKKSEKFTLERVKFSLLKEWYFHSWKSEMGEISFLQECNFTLVGVKFTLFECNFFFEKFTLKRVKWVRYHSYKSEISLLLEWNSLYWVKFTLFEWNIFHSEKSLEGVNFSLFSVHLESSKSMFNSF